MSIPINILLDGSSVFSKIERCEIKHDGGFCLSCTIDFADMTHWSTCNPVTRFGELIIKVLIGDDEYNFFCEERQATISQKSETFSVWGRSKQAYLTQTFSPLVNDTEDTEHIWQTQKKTYASAVIQYLIDEYAVNPVSVNFNITDFYIYKNEFTVSNKDIISVIKEIAEGVGAEVIGNPDGSLSIDEYKTDGDNICDLTDLDDVIGYSENIQYQSGFNAVTVYGYNDEDNLENGGDGGGGNDGASLSAMGATELLVGAVGEVKVYYYHPDNLVEIVFYADDGAICEAKDTGTEQITEDVDLSWGQGSTSLPNMDGMTSVSGNESEPFGSQSVTYEAYYKLYEISSDTVGEYKILFYFDDKSAECEHVFTVLAPEPDCSTLSVTADPTSCVPGAVIKFTVTNPEEMPCSAVSSAGQSVDAISATEYQTTIPDDFEEETATVTFSFGECDDIPITISVLHEGGGVPPTPDNPSGTPQATLTAKWIESISPAYPNYVYSFRAYGYNPSGAPVMAFSDNGGSVIQTNSGLEPQNETVEMGDGIGETQYPNADGATVVTASPDYPLDSKTVNYNAPYWEFGFTGTAPGAYKIKIWFADNAAETTLSITLVAKPGGGGPGGETKPLEILYLHDATDVSIPIEGASCYSDPNGDGVYALIGLTDSNGQIKLYNFVLGHHVVKWTKNGYIPSETDELENDSFEIEA